MSLVPLTTQVAPHNELDTQKSSKEDRSFVVVHTENMTERQSALMKACQDCLTKNQIPIRLKVFKELEALTIQYKIFIIPTWDKKLAHKIKNRFEKASIYIPRAVLEALENYQLETLPRRHFVISLAMYNCRIFLVKSLSIDKSYISKINEMAGEVVGKFKDEDLNVVVTGRADEKYVAKAFERNIHVVSKEWIDDNYKNALEEDDGYFNHDAMKTMHDHQIKPFYGLRFTIIDGVAPQVQKLIRDNDGSITYGNTGETCTHIVTPIGHKLKNDYADHNSGSKSKTKIVDEEFILFCVKTGYYVAEKENHNLSDNISVKREFDSQGEVSSTLDEKYIPPLGYSETTNENQAITLLPQLSCASRRQASNMNDMILKALSTFDTPQTQLAATQMRRLPDPELRIEPTYEPSQQLYWNDSVSRRS